MNCVQPFDAKSLTRSALRLSRHRAQDAPRRRITRRQQVVRGARLQGTRAGMVRGAQRTVCVERPRRKRGLTLVAPLFSKADQQDESDHHGDDDDQFDDEVVAGRIVDAGYAYRDDFYQRATLTAKKARHGRRGIAPPGSLSTRPAHATKAVYRRQGCAGRSGARRCRRSMFDLWSPRREGCADRRFVRGLRTPTSRSLAS